MATSARSLPYSAPSRPRSAPREFIVVIVSEHARATIGYARVWGQAGFDGQQVGREHPVADGDVVELHE